MAPEPHWTAYVSALLVPLVAVFGSIIAYQQWRTARNKLKLDLFDRRFSVYHAARSFLASILTSGKAREREIFKFISGTREAKWLLNDDVAKYLEKELYYKALDLQCLASELEGVPVGEERSRNVQKQSEIKKWFGEQYEVLDQKFSAHLELKH